MDIKTDFNIVYIRENVKKIQKDIEDFEMAGISDSFEIELKILELYPEFYDSHPFLVKKICKREDLSTLYKMLRSLEEVERGDKSLSSVELKLGNDLASEYIYPKIN